MSNPRAYLDYNASAPLLPMARAAMIAAIDTPGNPSSVHGEGRAARRTIDEARAQVAKLLGARADCVVFTSGATEAAAMLLTPEWRLGKGALRVGRAYVATSDHACLLGGGRLGRDRVSLIGVDGSGRLRLDELRAALDRHDRQEGLPLVAMHAANNESGVLQPIEDISALVKEAGGIMVWDAVQAIGRMKMDIADGCGDFFILSAHKIGGPKGVGAVVGASDLMMPLPLVGGGGQERGHRGGTENLAGIAGFGAAAAEALAGPEGMPAIRALRDSVEDSILAIDPKATIFGKEAERLANTVFFAIPGVRAETAQIGLDLEGFAVSAGSACSSGKVGPSHVIKAMGYDVPAGALRVSIGPATTHAEIERFCEALKRVVSRLGARDRAA